MITPLLILFLSCDTIPKASVWIEDYKDPYTLANYYFVNGSVSQRVSKTVSVSALLWFGVYDLKQTWVYKNVNIDLRKRKWLFELSVNPEKADEYNQAVYLTAYLNF